MSPGDVRTCDDLARLLSVAIGGTARVAEPGPLDLWNAHDDGNGPGWTALIEIPLPQDVPIQRALEALRAWTQDLEHRDPPLQDG